MSNLLSQITPEPTASPDTPLDRVQTANTGVTEEPVVENTEGENTEDSTVVDAELTPSEEDKAAVTPNDDGIINIDIAPIKKKRFSINGDLDNMLELNISDVTIVQRLTKALKQLNTLQSNALATSKDLASVAMDDEEAFTKMSDNLEKIDKEMRDLVDFIFNAPVSKACARDGSMYDMFKGSFRYEHIIETLMKLYESNIKVEYNEMRSKLSKHTSKYTKKKR